VREEHWNLKSIQRGGDRKQLRESKYDPKENERENYIIITRPDLKSVIKFVSEFLE
jgi:hypothetical protein